MPSGSELISTLSYENVMAKRVFNVSFCSSSKLALMDIIAMKSECVQLFTFNMVPPFPKRYVTLKPFLYKVKKGNCFHFTAKVITLVASYNQVLKVRCSTVGSWLEVILGSGITRGRCTIIMHMINHHMSAVAASMILSF